VGKSTGFWTFWFWIFPAGGCQIKPCWHHHHLDARFVMAVTEAEENKKPKKHQADGLSMAINKETGWAELFPMHISLFASSSYECNIRHGCGRS